MLLIVNALRKFMEYSCVIGGVGKMAKPIVTIESYERGITNFPIIDMLESQ